MMRRVEWICCNVSEMRHRASCEECGRAAAELKTDTGRRGPGGERVVMQKYGSHPSQADTAQAERIDNTYRTREYKVYGMTHMHGIGIHRHR